MDAVNQVLVTLMEADNFARSQNPHHHRLAIVLLDNIIELQLRRKSETTFAIDQTTWYSGVRKHDRKRRKRVSREHGELLALAVSESLITVEESNLIAFAHRIRNRAYHEGYQEDKVDLQLGITFLCRLIRRRFPKWRNARFGMMLSPDKPIPVDEARNDVSGRTPLLFGFEEDADHDFLSEKHWARVLERCLTYDDTIDVRPLIKRRIDNLIDNVDSAIFQITEDEHLNFADVLARRFYRVTPVFDWGPTGPRLRIGPVGALNIYLAILDQEERLLDIADEVERDKEFHKLIGAHQFQKDVISSLDLDKYRAVAELVVTLSEPEGIAAFLKIEDELQKVHAAAKECASDLDAYIEHESDLRRGK